MAVKIEHFTIGPIGTNVYVAYDEALKEAVVIDPADRGGDIYEAVSNAGLTVTGILLTHGHFDHIGGVNELKKLSGCRIYASSKEEELLSDSDLNESGSMGREPVTATADVWLEDGDSINIGGMNIVAIYTPGHTIGSISYYLEKEKVLFSGDTLFNESVGRTDFPTGSMSMIIDSVNNKLLVLPEDVIVYPGHGPSTSIGNEKKYNPFI